MFLIRQSSQIKYILPIFFGASIAVSKIVIDYYLLHLSLLYYIVLLLAASIVTTYILYHITVQIIYLLISFFHKDKVKTSCGNIITALVNSDNLPERPKLMNFYPTADYVDRVAWRLLKKERTKRINRSIKNG